MGNIGGIEKIMVFGILVIIVTILGIAFFSATQVENDLNVDDLGSNRLNAAGTDVVSIFGSEESDPNVNTLSQQPGKAPFQDVLPGTGGEENGLEPLKANSTLNGWNDGDGEEQEVTDDGLTGEGAPLKEEPRPEVAPPAEERKAAVTRTYKIRKGDSFMKLARVLYGDEKRYVDIMAVNPDVNPSSLQIGQVINLPEPVSMEGGAEKTSAQTPKRTGKIYTVQKGDTLVGIAQKMYGDARAWKKIYQANRDVIQNPDMLPVGKELILP